MRILQIIDTTGPGGAEDVFIELTGHCVDAGHECVALIPGPGWVADRLHAKGLRVEFLPVTGTLNPRYLAGIASRIRRHRIDIVHAHLFGAGTYAALAGLVTRTPVLVTLHGAVDLPEDGRFWRLKTFAIARASQLVAVSEGVRDVMTQRLGLRKSAIEVVPNGIDIARFSSAPAADLRAAHGIPGDAFLIGTVGNIRPAKAYEVGLRALERLRAAGVDAHWVIAGQPDPGGSLQATLQAETARRGLTAFTHFAGFVAAPDEFLRALDGYLICSRTEGHPLSLCQAMASARPIVGTRCGIERFIEDGREAWLVPVDDDAALAEALGRVASDRAEATRRGAAAHVRAARDYDAHRAFDRYLALYRRLVPGAA